jgi:hypothetical protein
MATPETSATVIAPAPRASTPRTTAASARAPRGIVTDYNYVIGELKQIVILTAAILAILIVLYFVIG